MGGGGGGQGHLLKGEAEGVKYIFSKMLENMRIVYGKSL